MSIPPDPRRCEIWRVDLNPARGAEMSKVRPAVVINSSAVGRLPLRLIVPMTTWDVRYENYSWMEGWIQTTIMVCLGLQQTPFKYALFRWIAFWIAWECLLTV